MCLVLADGGEDSPVVREEGSENVVAADVEKRSAVVVLVSLVTVVVVGAGVVGRDVAADVVETVCVVGEEDMVRAVRAVLVAAAEELVEGSGVVALCEVLGRAGVLVAMVGAGEEETHCGGNGLSEGREVPLGADVVGQLGWQQMCVLVAL